MKLGLGVPRLVLRTMPAPPMIPFTGIRSQGTIQLGHQIAACPLLACFLLQAAFSVVGLRGRGETIRRPWGLVPVLSALLPACCVTPGRAVALSGSRVLDRRGPTIPRTPWEADEVIHTKPLGRHKALCLCPGRFHLHFVTGSHGRQILCAGAD